MEPLAPGIRRFAAALKKISGPSIADMTPAQIERAQRGLSRNALTSLICGAPRRGVRMADRTVPNAGAEIPIRVYTPERAANAARPLIVAMHGGGWVFGNLTMSDWMCGAVSRDLDAVVVSVGYRLAPRHPFPAAIEDCYRVLEWSASNRALLGATSERIGVMGESAGGNLAAVLCLLAQERAGPSIRHQALIYPAIDAAADTESRRINANAIILTAADMVAYTDLYVGTEGDRLDWRVSPLRAKSHRGLPPALIQVAGHDPLRDEGVLYARALERAGVPVTLTEYPAMPHGFVNFPLFSRDARSAMAQVVREQRKALSPRGDALDVV